VIKVIPALYLLMLSAPVCGQASSPPMQDADQSQPPVMTLKVVTGLVAISAVVKSKDGETRTGLTKDDFVLKQDDAIYMVAKTALASETGRKAMVILSDGGDNSSRRTLPETIEQADRRRPDLLRSLQHAE
jgi:hypothetical protein